MSETLATHATTPASVSGYLGPVRQAGYVVRDLGGEIRRWTEVLGVGPFFYTDHLPLRSYVYEGRTSEPHLSGALSYSGELQIELLAQHNQAPSMWREFLDAGGEGLHHVAFWTRNFDRDLATLTGRGLRLGHRGETGGPGGRFAYLRHGAGSSSAIELSELNAIKTEAFRLVAEAARTWDGRDPVRELSNLSPVPRG